MPATEAAPPTTAPPVEEQFSLAPAIFTLFPGFPRDPPLIDATEKLQRIIENLDRQHNAVKKNMLFLIERRASALVKKAKKDLADIETVAEAPCKTSTQHKEDIRNTIRRIRVPVKTGMPPGAYEIRDDTFQGPDPTLFVTEDQDMEMANTAPRTRESIRAYLTQELRDLAMRGASEMETYEAHAEDTTKRYKQSLERRKGRRPSASSSEYPHTLPKGILLNKNGERPPDKETIKKTAAFETYEDVVRRGSR